MEINADLLKTFLSDQFACGFKINDNVIVEINSHPRILASFLDPGNNQESFFVEIFQSLDQNSFASFCVKFQCT